MNCKGLFLSVLLLLLAFAPVKGTHLAGAELTYSCIGGNQYRVRLVMFRDCENGLAPFDNPVELFIFNTNSGSVYNTWTIPAPFNTPQLVPNNWDACIGGTIPFCVEEGIYETTITLPGQAGGYDIGWARCCRSNVITNLDRPECAGVTFLAHVPDPAAAVCNNMPTFNNNPSLFLCAGQQYYFDHSATDPDGDSLVYEISNPFDGLNVNGTGAANSSGACGFGLPDPVVNGGNPMGAAPYQNVTFLPNHSFTNPFGPGGYININPATGYLEAFPATNGIYVLAISVKEYRNGVLLSENKRDFQFYVLNCNIPDPPPTLTHDLSGLNSIGDTVFAQAGKPFCFNFTVGDAVQPSGLIVTPVSVSFGGNGGFPPPYATLTVNGTTPPVSGQICWRPPCQYIGQSIPIIISARDTNDCPNYNIVFDTVWVNVLPSPGVPPVLTHNLSGATTNGDTILIDVNEQFCYQFTLIDTLGGGNLTAQSILQDIFGNPLGQVHTVTTTASGDTIFGEVCWESLCNFNEVFMFVTTGTDEFQCPPENTALDTVWLRVLPPYNPPPTLDTDVSQNPVLNNDTIIARVHENFCFQFTVEDTSVTSGDSVGFGFFLQTLQGALVGGISPTYSALGQVDSIYGDICWTPACVNVDQTFRFVVRGIQVNDCQIRNFDWDTVYVRVIEPFKAPPLISHDLGPAFPDNLNIYLEDDESFCYDFTLIDTVIPTVLDYGLEVYFANGDTFTGALPILNYTQFLDSIVEGNICWTVPCELADQSFMIRMIGRDTFDCRVSNYVFDTVNVHHTENAPGIVSFCQASVLPGDASIALNWQPNSESDGAGYIIYRRREDETSYTAMDTIWDYADSAYVDTEFVVADEYSYCYQVQAVDRCGRLSDLSSEMCTFVLTGEVDEYTSILVWEPYRGWPMGVDQYRIYRNFPVIGTQQELLDSVLPLTRIFVDRDIIEARSCYRVQAQDFSAHCGVASWSNEICFDFPPTLYVPSAFTPNGDGLNDIFSSAGEFVRDFDLQIYDRWGKLLFHTQDVVAGWNGEINGTPAPEGVYVFRIVVVGYEGNVLTRDGSVTLIR